MRTISARETELLEKRGYMAELRFEVKDGDGTFQKLENFQGRNWILGAEWGDDTDNQVDEATVLLRRNFEQDSLAPLMEDSEANLNAAHSYDPLLDYNREVKLSARIRATDSFDPDGDAEDPVWMLVFQGFIDRVSWATDVLTVECRGLGKALQNKTIFSSAPDTLGDLRELLPVTVTTNDLVEDVIQTTLDNFVTGVTLFSVQGNGAPAFNPADSPGFVLSESYMLTQGQSVMEAIVEMVKDIQWTIRYKWQSVVEAFRLVLYDPEDPSETVQHTFDPRDIISVDEMSQTDEDIVNQIFITFKEDDGDELSLIVNRSDNTSIAAFGIRLYILGPPGTDAIRNLTDAGLLAQRILEELKDPKTNITITVPLFPWVEVHDFLKIVADNIHSSTDIIAKVRSHKHTVKAGKSSTQIQLIDGSDFASFDLLRQTRTAHRGYDGNAIIQLQVERVANLSLVDDTTTRISWPDVIIDTLNLFDTESETYDIDVNRDWRIRLQVTITYVNHAPTDPEVVLAITEDLTVDVDRAGPITDNNVPTGSPDRVKIVRLEKRIHTSVLTDGFQSLFATVKVQVDGGETVNVSDAIWTMEVY